MWLEQMLTFACYILLAFNIHWTAVRTQISLLEEPYDVNNDDEVSDSENCSCISYYQCPSGGLVTDGDALIDPRRKRSEVRDKDGSEDEKIYEVSMPSECKPPEVCCRHSRITDSSYRHRCGKRNRNGINNSPQNENYKEKAMFGEWPWQAVILKKNDTKLYFKCGAALIDYNHVLTLAHCVDKFLDDISSFMVRLGEWDLLNANEHFPHEDYEISEIFVHPNYSSNGHRDNIAIVKLSENVTSTAHISTICLPRHENDFTGKYCFATGWEISTYGAGNFSMILNEIRIPVMSHKDRPKPNKNWSKHINLFDDKQCVGRGVTQATSGRNGNGLLVCYISDSYVLAGITSWGAESQRPGDPGIFVNVKKHIHWIVSKTGKELSKYYSFTPVISNKQETTKA